MKQAMFFVVYFLSFVIAGILPLKAGFQMIEMSLKYGSWIGFFLGSVLCLFGVAISSICIMKFWKVLSPPTEKG